MKNILLISLLFSFSTVFSNWREIITPTNEDLNKIEIIDNIAFCGGKNGVLLKSIDLGETWIEIITSASGNITSILFIDSLVGFLTTSSGEIFKTINGGQVWVRKFTNSIGINGIDFENADLGLAVGDNGNIFRTVDGGNNWANLGVQSSFSYILNDVVFLNDTLAIAIGPFGSYFFSTNGGETWTEKNTNSTETFLAIEKKDNSTAAIVGTSGIYTEFHESSLSMGELLEVDNAGDRLKDIYIAKKEDPEKTIIVGFNSSLYIERNGWKNHDIDSINNLSSVHFYNDTIGIACGMSGKIYKTNSGGVPASRNELNKIDLVLYPNPAKKILHIKNCYNYENTIIYDTFGQLVSKQKIINKQIDVSNIARGIYYITIQSENKFYSAKFIKE